MKPNKAQAAVSAFHWKAQPTNKPLKDVRVVLRCDAVSTTQFGTYSKAVPGGMQ